MTSIQPHLAVMNKMLKYQNSDGIYISTTRALVEVAITFTKRINFQLTSIQTKIPLFV
jgi:hypothetical protein